MAARSATPDFGDDGVDEVDGRFPEPVAEPRSDADDPPALTSGFFGRRKAVPPIGEAKTPTSTPLTATSSAAGYTPAFAACARDSATPTVERPSTEASARVKPKRAAPGTLAAAAASSPSAAGGATTSKPILRGGS